MRIPVKHPWTLPKRLLGTFVILASIGRIQSEQKSSKQPNIVVIVADDLGWNDVSFHGADQIPTPNIDALAYNGVILNRHYVLPTCTPSRTAFFTGRYPIRTGMQGKPLSVGEPRGIPLNVRLLPEHLRNLGYRTRLVGKWHVGYYTNEHTPTRRGFESFYGHYSGYISYFNYTISKNNHTGFDLHQDTASTLEMRRNSNYATDVFTEEAVKVIENHDATEPLYLHLAHPAPHSSEAKEVVEVRNMSEVNSRFGYIENINRRKFAGMMMALDQSVGRIVKALGDANMLDNSIIVFMADNGAQTEGFLENYGSNYPLRGLKFTHYDGGVRGVACIYSPLIKNNSRVSEQLLHVTDWLPTFYSLAGGDVNDLGDIDGLDQWSAISLAENSARESLLINIDDAVNLRGVVSGKFKLIEGAADLYGNYYGDTGNNNSYPEYNITEILESDAGLAITSIGNSLLTETKILNLRSASIVRCNNFTDFANCSDTCLFNLQNDPCETTDVSADYPEIFISLSKMIEIFESELVPQTNTDVDPASYPEKFNGFWMPWVASDSSTIIATSSLIGLINILLHIFSLIFFS
ncbi:arylsulfatase B [Cephus cinctus]|uniref:Arylsulfatase B n=1 Tax=Cephus cinctus TaxID=211228 RepID=A0AAJ7CDV1_CEPCN|nr:arylsulfatase B [Cephus cinctus]